MVFRIVRHVLIICLLSLLGVRSVFAVDTTKVIVTDAILQEVASKYGKSAAKRIRVWKKLMENEGHRDERQKLELVNRFFNQLKFQTDMVTWSKADYWATPIEFLSTNAGDCEDFSIAKFFTLLVLGVPEEKLKITYVTALKLNQAHMVLTYYATPDAEPLVLDNLIKEIRLSSKRNDLRPLYNFNGLGLWKAKKVGVGRRVGDSAKMQKWQQLNAKIIHGM